MFDYYNYDEIYNSAKENPTFENLEALANWCNSYADLWNGECYVINDKENESLFPIFRIISDEDDECEIVGYDWGFPDKQFYEKDEPLPDEPNFKNEKKEKLTDFLINYLYIAKSSNGLYRNVNELICEHNLHKSFDDFIQIVKSDAILSQNKEIVNLQFDDLFVKLSDISPKLSSEYLTLEELKDFRTELTDCCKNKWEKSPNFIKIKAEEKDSFKSTPFNDLWITLFDENTTYLEVVDVFNIVDKQFKKLGGVVFCLERFLKEITKENN